MWLCSSQRENYEYGTKQDQMWEWIWIFEKYFKGKIDFPKEKLFEFLCIDIVTKMPQSQGVPKFVNQKILTDMQLYKLWHRIAAYYDGSFQIVLEKVLQEEPVVILNQL